MGTIGSQVLHAHKGVHMHAVQRLNGSGSEQTTTESAARLRLLGYRLAIFAAGGFVLQFLHFMAECCLAPSFVVL